MTTEPTPIACDMTNAPDTPDDRLAEYRDLFATSLLDRARTETGVHFRFRARPGLAEQIRDLAAREKACCAFMHFDIAERGKEIVWNASVVDSVAHDPTARLILDELYSLPDTAPATITEYYENLAGRGLSVVVGDDGIVRPAGSSDGDLASR